MRTIARFSIGALAALALIAAFAFFFIPNRAVGRATLVTERPAAAVVARLASTPPGASIAEGVTADRITSTTDTTVTADISFADGGRGRVAYNVTPTERGSRVEVRIERDLDSNPLSRMQAVTGGDAPILARAAAQAADADLNALQSAGFAGLEYTIEQVAPLNVVGPRLCAPNSSLAALQDEGARTARSIARGLRLRVSEMSAFVEEPGGECGRAGVLFEGPRPSQLTGDLFGTTPSGTAIRVRMSRQQYESGDELDRVDNLIAAARLEPTTTYALSADSSDNFDVYVLVSGDASALASILPPGATPPPPAGDTMVWCPEVQRRVTQNQCEDYTRLSQAAQAGEAAFNAPSPMQLHDTVTLQLAVSYAAQNSTPPQGASTSTQTTSPAPPPPGQRPSDVVGPLPGATQVFTPPVGRFMSAELSGVGFTVKPLSPASQEITEGDTTTWQWEVTADMAGSRQLFLRTSVDAPGPDGDRIPLRSTTRTQNIEVKVGFLESVKGFLEGVPVWLKLVTAILTALAALGVAWMTFGDTIKKMFSKKS